MIDLLELGYDVDGLDSSRGMLDLCRARAEESGLAPELHLGLMQSFTLSRRYRSIFLAGASFTLLTTDEDASPALANTFDHLEACRHALVPIVRVHPDEIKLSRGRSRETTDSTGARLRGTPKSIEVKPDGQSASLRLLYERIPESGEPVSEERVWERRWWTQEQFRELVMAAPFGDIAFFDPVGAAAGPDAQLFVALLTRN